MTTEALTDTAPGPQTDALVDQNDGPSPISTKLPEDDAPEKPEKRPSLDDVVSRAVDKVMKDDGEEKKPEPVKEEAKPAQKDRADDGKFTAKEKPEPVVEAAPKPTAFKEPPSGFDDAARGEWEATPESVRGAIHRRHRELEAGIEKYRVQAQEFDQLREFSEMAKKSGTDLKTAMSRYVGMEQELRRDPIAGLEAIVANLGLKAANGAPATLRDVAGFILGQKPEQIASRQDATVMRLTQQVKALQEQLGGVSQHVQSQRENEQRGAVVSEWTNFTSQNPRAKELEPIMAEFLTKYPAGDNVTVRERLEDAYAFASAKSPAPSVAHTDANALAQTQETRNPNPAGQRSITGAPRGELKSSKRKLGLDDAIEKAMRDAGL